VLEDADIGRAVNGAMFAVFLHSGQLCESGTRLLLSEQLYDAFLKRMKMRAESMRVGPTDSMETDIGPLISKEQLSKVEILHSCWGKRRSKDPFWRTSR